MTDVISKILFDKMTSIELKCLNLEHRISLMKYEIEQLRDENGNMAQKLTNAANREQAIDSWERSPNQIKRSTNV